MPPDDNVRIYKESCPSLVQLMREIERRPAYKLGPSIVPVDKQYAAGIWKELFLIALHRMAKKQPSLAQLTAAEALGVVLSSAASSFVYPRTAGPRHLIQKLRAMKERSLRGLASPRKGFHPLVLQHWKGEAIKTFRDGCEPTSAFHLWKSCGGGGNRIPQTLLEEISKRRTPNSRAMAFLAALTGTEEHVLRPTMSRQRRSSKL